jgi:hypothetical protein
VTAHALLVDLGPFQLLLRVFVEFVTVRAADLAQGKTQHGKCRRGQGLEGDELGIIAPVVLFDKARFQGLAAGTVAGLTVDEGHFGPLDLLLAVNTAGQELRCLIVIVTRLKTGLIAHIICEKRSD